MKVNKKKTQLRADILKKAFERAKKQNASFSLRSLAQKIEISPAFVSRIFNAKNDLPYERIDAFVKALKIDKLSENRLRKSYAKSEIESSAVDSIHENIMQKYVELPDKQFSILDKWYYIAILDLAGCVGFSVDSAWIAQRLAISETDARQAIFFLKAHEYLIQDENKAWLKNFKDTRLPTKDSREQIRNYHVSLSKKAIEQLKDFTQPKDFERRLITGISISADPTKLEQVKERLNQVMYEIAATLSSGDCTEVYHLNIHLFPLTKPK